MKTQQMIGGNIADSTGSKHDLVSRNMDDNRMRVALLLIYSNTRKSTFGLKRNLMPDLHILHQKSLKPFNQSQLTLTLHGIGRETSHKNKKWQ
jgi:hypothetical protein